MGLLLVASAARAEEPFRTWTNAEGDRKVEARLLSAEGERATFARPDGQSVAVRITQLSPADQRYVEEFAARQSKGQAAPAEPSQVGGLLAGWLPAAEAPPSELVHIRIARDFLARDLPKQVVQQSRLRDVILGSDVDSNSTTEATAELTLVPDEKLGLLEIRLAGQVHFKSTAHSGPMDIHNQGVTRFRSGKTIRFDGRSVEVEPAWTKADTQMQTTGMDTNLGLGRRLALRIAEREVARTRAEAERVTADHTAQRISRGLDTAVAANLGSVLSPLSKQLAQLTQDEQLGIRRVSCSTTPDYLEITLCGPGQENAQGPTWKPDCKADVQLAVHSSMIRRSLTDAEFRGKLQSLRDSVLQSAPGQQVMPVSLGAEDVLGKRTYSFGWSPDQRWLLVDWSAAAADEQPAADEPERTTAAPSPASTPLIVQGALAD